MSKLLDTVIDPILNDFVYTALYNAPFDQKRGLKGRYLKAAMSERAAKSFCDKASWEDKMHILSHLGLSGFFVISKNSVGFQKLKEILRKFESGKTHSALEDIVAEGLFVTGDKEFLRLLGFMSQSIHHNTFRLNLELIRQGYNINRWKKTRISDRDDKIREVDESCISLAKSLLGAIVYSKYFKGLSGVSENEIQILLYLYQKPHTHIDHNILFDYFNGRMSKTEFTYAMKSLLNCGNIQRNSVKANQYTISGPGTKQVNNFINIIVNSNNF